uniref:Arylsulfatase regulator (Fe-S oxidoreductase) n=1 Tax=uncultured Thiotrichaceae bacterium TaxID=298394 RepID=A0A6S6UIT9_9GAMM|nr:MAG: Arylsulfatase regulator (Fe-S oxidoreductase) [uncultured Thiotrichaceae bacterium]
MVLNVTDRHQHTRPRSAKFHLFCNESEQLLLDVEGGRVLPVPVEQSKSIGTALQVNDILRAEMMAMGLGLITAAPGNPPPPKSVPVKALSLAIAQKCNLGCTYCYAEQGTFGGKMNNMPPDVAQSSVDQLLTDVKPGEKVTLAFMGGEPLTNRKLLHASTRYAALEALSRGIGIGFTLTTNATLIRSEDIELFQKYRFTLTISIDGLQATNDQLRPFASGKGSFDRVAKSVSTLLGVKERSYRLLARVTVTPKNLDLQEIMTGLLEMGFDGIMFSPMLSAPSGRKEMQSANLDRLLEQLIKCGETFSGQLQKGQILPFTNIITTLQRIHHYQRDQYPCGAGGGYMGVSAEGELYACHRFVNDEQGHMGNVRDGVDGGKQIRWLDERNLQKQSPCTSCWARYLCSGSCHYEVINRGRPACDYIRGWLDYCLTVYAGLSQSHPEALEEILAHD